VVRRLRDGVSQALAANVDVVFIVTSANHDFNIGRLERYYVLARESGARTCFVLSKCDLTQDSAEYEEALRGEFRGCGVIRTRKDEFNPGAFDPFWLAGERAIFIGSSGVGKSTLVNALLGADEVQTQEIRQSDGRGRHTTTVRQMHVLADGRAIIDTPGLRSVGVGSDASAIEELFPEVENLAHRCRFRNCRHGGEPGCAIHAALVSGELEPSRYTRYLKLKNKENLAVLFKTGRTYQKEDALKILKKEKHPARLQDAP
jgi:ribosome biogenesis GTPase